MFGELMMLKGVTYSAKRHLVRLLRGGVLQLRNIASHLRLVWSAPRSVREAANTLVPEDCEIALEFRSGKEWSEWRESNADRLPILHYRILSDIGQNGIIEPVTGRTFRPRQIHINSANYRESLICGHLNSRMRALLFAIGRYAPANSERLRVLAPEAVTPFATVLSKRFPLFLGTEYLPNEEDRRRHPGVKHMDIQEMPFGDAEFDLFVSGEVLEHVPFPDKSISEMYRVLKPGGMAISTYPFLSNSEVSQVKASLDDDGNVIYHAQPEYHGNPLDPNGSLVFTLPGWDVVKRFRDQGFADALFLAVASSRHGVVSHDSPLVFVSVARRAM